MTARERSLGFVVNAIVGFTRRSKSPLLPDLMEGDRCHRTLPNSRREIVFEEAEGLSKFAGVPRLLDRRFIVVCCKDRRRSKRGRARCCRIAVCAQGPSENMNLVAERKLEKTNVQLQRKKRKKEKGCVLETPSPKSTPFNVAIA